MLLRAQEDPVAVPLEEALAAEPSPAMARRRPSSAGRGGKSGRGGAAGASAAAALRRRRPMVNPDPSSHCAPSRFLTQGSRSGQPSRYLSRPALERKEDLFGFRNFNDITA